MSKPTQFTTSDNEMLKNYLASTFGDSFFLNCYQNFLDDITDGIFSSFSDWVSFYFIGMAAVYLVIILPVIFLFQASGKQKKMQKLYHRSRLQLLKFLYTCTFANLISPVLGWITQQPGPCAHTNQSGPFMNYLGFEYQLPSVNVVIETAMAIFFMKYGGRNNNDNPLFLELNPVLRKIFTICFNGFIVKLMAVFFIIFLSVYDVLYGKSNVLQILFSICFGIVIECFISLVPVIVSFVCSCLLFFACVAYLICNPLDQYKTSYAYDNAWSLIISGFGYQFFVSFLLVMFIQSHNDFSWFDRFSAYLEDEEVDLDQGNAAFAELDLENVEEEKLDLKGVLTKDLIYSGLAFLVQILISALQALIVYYKTE
ncbi:hypothetical protein GPJ56_007399 [Histomonas meleagridis]|uniref:uncharacterized protein n=1 Tax=Histomonas meleagridis TaxID=135588 RepID=UPI0035597E4D|nr:hypothetical protein GPJ56_007399 [Histomonas meleagridis]KAH0804245.1 hypothetical protein GO595_003075 [Histomonas meleagridis]